MRPFLAFAVTALLASPAFLGAQEQDPKLLERIQRPNMELVNPMQGKTFNGGGGVKIQEAAVGRAAFDSTKTAALKEFSGTRSFLGIKNPWFGNRVFETKAAPLSGLGGPAKLDAAYPTREAAIGGFAGSDKRANLGSSRVEVQPFLVRGEAQGALEQISDKISKEMTIDDIRELLNKPR